LVAKGARLPDDVLMGPVHERDVATVRFLIRHGANVNCIAVYMRSSNIPVKEVLLSTAIRQASCDGAAQSASREFRLTKSAKWRAAHPPCAPMGDVESIPIMLIKAGATVDRLESATAAHGKFARTMLGHAAQCGLVRTVKAMLAAGADVNLRDTWGGTALLDAAESGRREVVRALLAAGARKDLKRRDGATPVSVAREFGFADLADEIENYRNNR